MSVVYDFDEMLAISRAKRSETDAKTLLLLIPGAIHVEATDEKEKDKRGIDYIVTLRRGAQIYKVTDYILYTFHPDDTDECFLIPFQLLRMAAIRNIDKWLRYKKREVTSRSGGRTWTTQFTYVPYSILVEAINKEMRLKRTAL